MARRRVSRGWGGSGKAPPDIMEGSVYSHLGRKRENLLVGPGRGLDNAVISLPGGGSLVVTTDPISMIPGLGARTSAWLSVHLIASDLTASGVDPEFATFSYNFPKEVLIPDRKEYLRSVGEECERLGVAIVGGNTGTYPGSESTVIGAGTMFAIAPLGAFVTPAMARVGDRILMTKHAAIEATASLANSFPRFVAGKVGTRVAERARRMIRLCTTVRDAQAARRAKLGKEGVPSIHDATQGGVLGALDEMASASKKRFVVRPLDVPVSEEATSVCLCFGLDPLRTMGEGALLVTCSAEGVKDLERAMSDSGIAIKEIGAVEEGEGLFLSFPRRLPTRFKPGPDEYWKAYERAAAGRLS